MNLVAPEVYLIARPSIDWQGVQAYLDVVGGQSWAQQRMSLGIRSDQPDSDAQHLIEFAGRTCYRSWEAGLNPNVTRIRRDQGQYLRNILASGHGSVLEHASFSFVFRNVSRVFCYDPATEVLTSAGWKRWPDVDGTETFATLNPDTDAIEYQQAEEHFAGWYAGPMYRVQSEQVDLLVTANHRMWVQKYDTQAAKRAEEEYAVYSPAQIAGKRVKYLKTGTWNGTVIRSVAIPATTRSWVHGADGAVATRRYKGHRFPAVPFARFLGHFLSEGSIQHHTIVLAQNRGPMLDMMAENIRAMGLRSYIPATGPGAVRTWHIALRDFVAACGESADTKRVPALVHNWTPTLIRTFLDAYADGDGSRRKKGNHTVIYTTSPQMADDLQILAIKAGWSANVRVDDRTGLVRTMATGQQFQNQRPCYIVSLVKTRTHPLVNHNGSHNDRFVPYEGMVYCVKVPNGLLFVRRNGKPVVSGNTHELVRHRVGVGISQESLRYVRLVDIKFWIPPVLEPLRDRVIHIVEQLEQFQVEAADYFELDQLADFHNKKLITSAMRRLAPDGLATDIVWTTNVRTARHVLEMRTDEGAEEEMRYVFGGVGAPDGFMSVGRYMQRELPQLFGDYTVNAAGEWVTPYPKV